MLFLLAGTVSALPVLTTANWAAGCNGNPYGAYNWPTPTGGYSGTLHTPNVATGTLDQQVRAYSPPTSSNLQEASYFMVGPATSGCYTPTTTHAGLFVTYTWQITVNPYLAANCSQDGSATAKIYATVASNVHIGVAPWYVAPGASSISSTIPTHTVSCTNGGSNIWNPGPTFYGSFAQTFGPWTATGGTSYDFYSSQWVNATTTSSATGATAVSQDTTTATLVSVNCPAC
jgi:hypothetical protein